MSVAFDRLPSPDWASTTTIAVAETAPRDPRQWAEAVFDARSLPFWAKGMFAAREVVVRVLGIPPGDPSMLAVSEVVGDEAVVDTDDRHLRFVASVRTAPGLVHVTTAVRLKGWRGRVYFAPVRFLHDPVTRSMMTNAARRFAGTRPAAMMRG